MELKWDSNFGEKSLNSIKKNKQKRPKSKVNKDEKHKTIRAISGCNIYVAIV